MKAGRKHAQGATLIETLVVLAILGGLAAMATLALRMPPGLVLDRTARGIASDLQQARVAALTQGHPVLARFDAEKRQVLVPSLELVRQVPRAVTFRATGALAVNEARDSETVDVLFYPDASSSGAEIDLTTRAQNRRISVHWLSGQVRYVSGP